MAHVERRLPVEPLVVYAKAAALRRTRPHRNDRAIPGSEADVADVLGVDYRQVKRWERTGVRIHEADRLACRRLGVHPSAVWGAQWWQIPDSKRGY